MSKLVSLSAALIERCTRYGKAMVESLHNEHANIGAMAIHGIEDDPVLQAKACMAECAFCLCAGLDPLVALDWELRPDPGYDAIAWGQRWDVKATEAHHRYLIWPRNKNHLYAGKQFDRLALVKIDPPWFNVHGWVTKQDFARKHHTAGPGHKLDPGTWHMDGDDLIPFGACGLPYCGEHPFGEGVLCGPCGVIGAFA